MRTDTVWKSCLFAICLVAGAAADAQTEATQPDMRIPDCRFSRPATIIASLNDAPDIAAEFKRLGVVVADVGEPFVPYDVVDGSKNLPNRQFLRAYAFADRTIGWYYHGGIGTHIHVFELRKQIASEAEASKEPILRLTGATLSGPPCQATQALLDGVRGLKDW
ncbi:MAG: hypothetical protein KKA44_14720 [Alphaproteobacteria bacterium]|nr:hypothetical protein [Alphaproteobacteria bacterium]MBU0863935.1 hypothetical protein [Alphaproteobacteria bacterium]MBU1826207.1 hypothetical protein [Alphaproteobacteria bacterium]